MSKAIAPIPPTIIPHPLSYHKGELACLVVGVALLALAFILKSQNLIPHGGFIGLIAGGCGLSIISLIILAKRYYEKYHFTKDDIKMIEDCYLFQIKGRKINVENEDTKDIKALIFANKSNEVDQTKPNRVDEILNSVIFDYSRDGLFKCVFNYVKTEKEPDLLKGFVYSKSVDGARGEILYALRAISCGNTKILTEHTQKVIAYRKLAQTVG